MAGTVVFTNGSTFQLDGMGDVTLTFDVTGNNEDAVNATIPGTTDDFNTGYIVTDANGTIVTGGLDNGVGGPTTNETVDFPQLGLPGLTAGTFNLHAVLLPNSEAIGLFLAAFPTNGNPPAFTDAASAQAYLDANSICGDLQVPGTQFTITSGGTMPLIGAGGSGGVYPNPVTDYITVDMYELGVRAAQNERVTVRLVAPDGRIVDTRRVVVATGRETVRMYMMHLQGGIYQVQVLQRGTITTRRVTKL